MKIGEVVYVLVLDKEENGVDYAILPGSATPKDFRDTMEDLREEHGIDGEWLLYRAPYHTDNWGDVYWVYMDVLYKRRGAERVTLESVGATPI